MTEDYKKVRRDPKVHCLILRIGQNVWDVLVMYHLDLFIVGRSA